MWFFWGWGQHFVLYRGFFCLRRWGGGFDFAVQAGRVRWYARCDLVLYALPVGALDFAMASGLSVRGADVAGWCVCLCAGIRVMPSCFKRRPCAGRHLLFFAAAKKSRQKKAANTASPCSYPRALNVPMLHKAVPWLVLVANASNECLTRFEYAYLGKRQRMVCAAQVANCV